jgi:hypothetical protein
MYKLITIIGLVFCVACQSDKIQKEDVQIVSDCHDVKVENSDMDNSITTDTVVIPGTIIDFEIDDYYSHFFGTNIKDIENNSPEDAFKYGTFILNTLDYKNGYISFRTQNTPLKWDGDSETEDGYEITFWVQSDSSRIVAFCKTKYTWVDQESTLTLFLHDKIGINKITPEYQKWVLNDFLDRDVSSHFSDTLMNNPPVSIKLPSEGKQIRFDLALEEHYDQKGTYEKFDSLKLTRHTLMVNPLIGKVKKVKAW